MAIYTAIINIANIQKVISESTPALLGTAIGNAISADPRDDVEVRYSITGPSSRRMVIDKE